VCRGSQGVCDVAETCTGSSAACPADQLRDSSFVCRSTSGICDVEEHCTGSGTACPADQYRPLDRNVASCAPGICPGNSPICTSACITTADCATTAKAVCVGNTCSNGRVAFVSSVLFNPTSGYSGAVAACSTAATNAGLTGTFLPFVSSTGVSPSTNLMADGRVFIRRDKTIIATSKPDLLDGLLAAPILFDENGYTDGGSQTPWTGTDNAGVIISGQTCAGWASSGSTGYTGQSGAMGSWSAGQVTNCNVSLPVFCFEN
jgi:hypothetical protein